MSKAEIQPGKRSDISIPKQITRKLTSAVLGHTVLRYEETDNDHSVDKAEGLLNQGHGLIVVINHFSRPDPPYAVEIIFDHPTMGKKEIVVPIAVHVDNFLFHLLGRADGFTPMPIVTKNSVKRERYQDREVNEGMKEYLTKSIDSLKEGKIVVIAPQGERQDNLGQPNNPTIGTLMKKATTADLENYAFLFIGFGIKGIDDYSKKRGFNLLDKYTATIGACLTREEVMAKATTLMEEAQEGAGDVSRKPKNPFRFVDGVIYAELRKVVPPNYR